MNEKDDHDLAGCCQLSELYTNTFDLTRRDQIRTYYLRIRSALKRRKDRLFCEASNIRHGQVNCKNGDIEMKEGDIVEILSYEEILKTLDENECCEGLQFLDNMKQYTGGRYVIYKKVRTIFDERLRKMVKLRNTVLLKDVICNGSDMYAKEGCDRCCFLFWKERWLKKV
jgi:hypothetical protein